MGLLDLVMGTGDYADPTKMDPNYGVPLADSRQAMFNAIGNMGAILMAAGQKISPEQRAAYLGQLGQVGPQVTNDMMNSAQRRLMQAQYGEKQREIEGLRALDDERKRDPKAIAEISGLPVAFIQTTPVRDLQKVLQQIQVQRATNPLAGVQSALEVEKLRREIGKPQTYQVGNTLYERTADGYKVVAQGAPTGGLEERNRALIARAMQDPTVADTPEYAQAYDAVYGAKQVTGFNPQTQQMEYQFLTPPVPQGVPRPRFGAPQAGSAAAGATVQAGAPEAAPAPSPAPGSVISQRPPEAKPLTEDQSRATGFAIRMAQASKVLDPLDFTAASKPGFAEVLLGNRAGDQAIGFLRDGERQRYAQAQRDWVTANLRKESGAVIGVEEMNNEIAKYFPMPGDKPEVIEQKRKSREAATQAMIIAAGKGAKDAGVEFKPYEPAFDIKLQTMSLPELLTFDYKDLSPADKAKYLMRLDALTKGGR